MVVKARIGFVPNSSSVSYVVTVAMSAADLSRVLTHSSVPDMLMEGNQPVEGLRFFAISFGGSPPSDLPRGFTGRPRAFRWDEDVMERLFRAVNVTVEETGGATVLTYHSGMPHNGYSSIPLALRELVLILLFDGHGSPDCHLVRDEEW